MTTALMQWRWRRSQKMRGSSHCSPWKDKRAVLQRKSRLGDYSSGKRGGFHSCDWKRRCDQPGRADAMVKETGCDGVMIARGAQGNPWIFSEMIEHERTGKIPSRPTNEEIRKMMLRHAKLQLQYKGEYLGIREMRKHVAWYTKGLPGSAKLQGRDQPG